ncbi:hypothetical protein J6590_021636 [Homalodisca vitripennis]|nr:hypothetical protein J6590_021636 [Homalodisca vitripennis]
MMMNRIKTGSIDVVPEPASRALCGRAGLPIPQTSPNIPPRTIHADSKIYISNSCCASPTEGQLATKMPRYGVRGHTDWSIVIYASHVVKGGICRR